jgi:hypothetical protein
MWNILLGLGLNRVALLAKAILLRFSLFRFCSFMCQRHVQARECGDSAAVFLDTPSSVGTGNQGSHEYSPKGTPERKFLNFLETVSIPPLSIHHSAVVMSADESVPPALTNEMVALVAYLTKCSPSQLQDHQQRLFARHFRKQISSYSPSGLCQRIQPRRRHHPLRLRHSPRPSLIHAKIRSKYRKGKVGPEFNQAGGRGRRHLLTSFLSLLISDDESSKPELP